MFKNDESILLCSMLLSRFYSVLKLVKTWQKLNFYFSDFKLIIMTILKEISLKGIHFPHFNFYFLTCIIFHYLTRVKVNIFPIPIHPLACTVHAKWRAHCRDYCFSCALLSCHQINPELDPCPCTQVLNFTVQFNPTVASNPVWIIESQTMGLCTSHTKSIK